MPSPSLPPDLVDLKFLPAWVTEPSGGNEYAHFEGEDETRPRDRGGDRRPERPRRDRPPARAGERPRDGRGQPNRTAPGARPHRGEPRRDDRRPAAAPLQLPVAVEFLPSPRSLEHVLAQMRSSHIAYSVFALARLFLEKPERYEVRLRALDESAPLFQLGETGVVALERGILEAGAFAAEKESFYRVEVVQTEPLKGNFSNVARSRLDGIFLGPTNHHAYQAQLRSLYEQRYSRRMSFPDFQRQIEIVTNPEEVERWKEEARNVTTFTTLKEEPPVVLQGVAEAERHFRQTYLPALIRPANQLTISGVISRQLPDRALGRWIEATWTNENYSPTRFMQQLCVPIRDAGLHIFRHKKNMLFAGTVRPRPFTHAAESVSPSVSAILGTIREAPGISRRELAERVASGMPAPSDTAGAASVESAAVDRAKRTLAADLHWLVSEGHVIEFNDGTLELARSRAGNAVATPAPTPASGEAEDAPSPVKESVQEVPEVQSEREDVRAQD